MAKSGIEYIDWVINFIKGCTKISEGCKHCYAEAFYGRFNKETEPFETVRIDNELMEKRFDEIANKPGMVVGINFMADTFHDSIVSKVDWIKMYDLILAQPQHQFILFTKRYKNLGRLTQDKKTPDNLHYGVSICNEKDLYRFLDQYAGEKVILSLEPLLEDIVYAHHNALNIAISTLAKWVIVGAESGNPKHRRPYNEEWAERIRFSCKCYKVPFYHKQQFINNEKTHLLKGKAYLHNPYKTYRPTKASDKLINQVIDEGIPWGMFYRKIPGGWIGIDNTTGDAWTEEFVTKERAIDWMTGKAEEVDTGTLKR